MMAVIKEDYELSVWNEELNADGVKIESKGAIIGSNTMEFLGRATDVKLKREIRGTNTLTFQMPTKYFDSEKGQFVKNELIDELYNERKIKLKKGEQWFEFYIKSIQEQKQYKAIMKVVTCQDSFIDELSRTGYEIEFSPELNNSVEEIGTFMDDVLDMSTWDYRPEFNSGDFTEFKEQRFYKIPLSQFGGSISAYPIDLKVYKSDLKKNSDYYSGKSFNADDEVQLKNIFDNSKRTLEYGDDLAREKELFLDPYYKDNGRSLLNNANKVELNSDYIYVPITDLQMIMGAIYNNSRKAIEEPALYGSYGSNKGYALQPYSKNPSDLVQFICFQTGDEVKIDEAGVLCNNDCHYVIKIGDWNSALEKVLKNNKETIHWTSPTYTESTYSLSSKYSVKEDGDTKYTVGVMPNTRTVDDFTWYPVYYEGYLEEINDEPVTMARKISITDRTELNVNDDIYATVYNQRDKEFAGLYSEDELNELINRREQLLNKKNLSEAERSELEKINKEFRVCSKIATRLIVPSLARNLVDNGQHITETNAWEWKTQNVNNKAKVSTGSYYKLMEINTRSTLKKDEVEDVELLDETEIEGTEEEESVSDFYLEILSPYIEKSDDFSLEGVVETDYALNFGFVSKEQKIEKDKVYAIRLRTGKWEVDENGNDVFVKKNNVDLDKIVIGEGSTNLQGNYIIDGIDNISNNANFISFSEFADLENIKLAFLPNEFSENDTNYLQNPLYYTRNKNDINNLDNYANRWSWKTQKDDSKYQVEDNAFLLFKAKKTIENPYIAIRVDSEPAEMEFNSIQLNEYTKNNGTGIKICVATPDKTIAELTESDLKELIRYGVKYVDGIKIEVYQITDKKFSEDFLESVGYDSEQRITNLDTDNKVEGRDFGELKDDDILALRSNWSTTSSSTIPSYYSGVALQSADSIQSYSYALFIDDNYYGIFWLENNNGEVVKEEEEVEEDNA